MQKQAVKNVYMLTARMFHVQNNVQYSMMLQLRLLYVINNNCTECEHNVNIILVSSQRTIQIIILTMTGISVCQVKCNTCHVKPKLYMHLYSFHMCYPVDSYNHCIYTLHSICRNKKKYNQYVSI